MRFIALIDKEERSGSYGISFPQLPGCVAMGRTMDEAVRNATDALSEWIGDEAAAGRTYEAEDLATFTAREEVSIAIGAGAVPVFIPLVQELGRPIKANLSLDAGLLYAIDEAAKNRGLTRSSWLASAARQALVKGG
ncbi:type II toxin-antitoxin system HicB family antitoxin [Hansschlegelia beijingensis]|uniref:Putative RNase H-like HicB family nuclease n=1 Tax=Hansschlegelia beijingensis TaxID=1133344 RepID=A0A7W6CYU0_9HYPH|nr:type II toxin-antitoxin system HicB family antitoxin [Hansschlegelia beijingensis]MBB3972759.1 putative RNase H-like HicB family nuclease [Hansschlegelia beijingensis]